MLFIVSSNVFFPYSTSLRDKTYLWIYFSSHRCGWTVAERILQIAYLTLPEYQGFKSHAGTVDNQKLASAMNQTESNGKYRT